MSTNIDMTLKNTICRPFQIATGSWTTADTFGTALASLSLPNSMLTLPIVSRKLDGFQGIRGSITLRLQVTGNPFQQGLLRLQFFPMLAYDPSFTGRYAAAESWSFWPSVEVHLSTVTAAEMRVPFVMPVSFVDLVTTTVSLRPEMGVAYVRVYSPLKVGSGSTSAGWTVYAHWNEDDLQLFSPTPNSFQAGRAKVVGSTRLPSERERTKPKISELLEAGGNVAQLATAVPVLSDFAGPTAWALRVGARVASTLGFARPDVDSVPQPVTQLNFPYNSNVEGPDVSQPLSLTIQPGLRIEPMLTGKKEDEMTIDYFVTKFGYRNTINISTAIGVGTNILNMALGTFESVGSELSYPKPFQLLGKLFNFWRGNLRVRLKFVKTKMHSMRLMFVFVPGVLTNVTLAQTEYVIREIVDIADVDELTFELPFTANTPYLYTQNSGIEGNYGSFQVLVVNPLQAPSTVASNIDMIVETAMGEGAEFIVPYVVNDLLPTVDGVALTNRPQAGPTSVVSVNTLSTSKLVGPQEDTSQLCVGEKLLSLRQLIKYPGSMANPYNSVSVLADGSGYVAPTVIQPFRIGACTATMTQAVRCRDFLNMLAPYYRFSRGGMRVRGVVSTGSAAADQLGTIVATCRTSSANGIIGPDTSATLNLWGGDFNASVDGTWRYTLPAWQTSPMVPHSYALANSGPLQYLWARQNALVIRGVDFPAGSTVLLRYNRQPADDYELLYFIGPPLFQACPPP